VIEACEYADEQYDIIEPDIERPTVLTSTPCARLWAAVIVDALREARFKGKIGDEARTWLASSSEAPGSYRWIVYSLGGDPDIAKAGTGFTGWRRRLAVN
jgi:hypothetical protein